MQWIRTLSCSIGIMFWLTACSLLYADDPAVEKIPNELPRSWDLSEIEKQVPPYGVEGRVYVLAWKVIEDDRPLRVESCLVLKVLNKDDDYGRWCMAHLYRRPEEKQPEWRLSTMHISGDKGTPEFPGRWIHHAMRFKEQPRNKQVYASLGGREVGWKFDLDNNWKFVGCGVCEANWKAVIGEAPTQFFGR